MHQIVIVGAGLAGLTAACYPSRAGCKSFVLLETRNVWAVAPTISTSMAGQLAMAETHG